MNIYFGTKLPKRVVTIRLDRLGVIIHLDTGVARELHKIYFVNVNADKLNMHRLIFFNEKSCYCLLSLPALYCFGEGNFHSLGMPDVIWFRTKCSFIIHNIFKIKLQSLWEELYLLCPLSLPGRVCSIHGMSICQQYHDLGGIFPV